MMEVINLHPLSDEQDPYGEYQVEPLARLEYWIEGKLKDKLNPNDPMKAWGVPATREERPQASHLPGPRVRAA